MEWNEDLHKKLQELKAATDPAEKKRLVDEAIALAKRGPRATLDAAATTGCKVSFETYNNNYADRARSEDVPPHT